MSCQFDNLVIILQNRYNPENDIIPGAPRVTHTDICLLELIGLLRDELTELRKELTDLKNSKGEN